MVRAHLQKADHASRYGTLFEVAAKSLNGASMPLLAGSRQEAIDRFLEMGFPTTRDEDWRYTRLDPIWKTEFEPALAGPSGGISAADVKACSPYDDSGIQLVFINGHYAAGLSSADRIPSDLSVGSLAQASTKDQKYVEPHLNRHVPFKEQAFVALNTAFAQDGAFVRIGKESHHEHPIHLLFLTADVPGKVFSSPRILIVAETGSRARVVESYVACGKDASLTNVVSEIVVEEGANLDHYKIQRGGSGSIHLDTMHMVAASNATFRSTCVTVAGLLTRNNVSTVLDGEEIDSTLNGLYLVDGEEHIDNDTLIEHAQPNCGSHEFYKGILSGSATSAFRGRILVRRPAQKTDAYQSNQNLLLSEKADVNTRPQLEIYADDVKCSHGATVGQLDEDAIFYLRSRGLGRDTAIDVLTRAFAGEVIDRIENEQLRDLVSQLAADKLEAGRVARSSI
jgi:Fe-S cluster assembly protein SufD